MKRHVLFFIILAAFSILQISAAEYALPEYYSMHKTQNGFTNPFPDFKPHSSGDFFSWISSDEHKFSKQQKSREKYNPVTHTPDLEFIKTNRTHTAVTWIGHSALLVQIGGLNILTDPVFSERCSPVSFAGPKRMAPPVPALSELPPIDVVLISHDHYDHLDKATIRSLGNTPLYIVPIGIKEYLNDWGITNVVELDWWQEYQFHEIRFACTPAQHFSNRSIFNRNTTLWCSWFVAAKNDTFYFGGDTGYSPAFKDIFARYGKVSIAALPIGAFKPRNFMGPVHMDPEDALNAFNDLHADFFVPIHWGTFDMADDLPAEAVTLLRKNYSKHTIKPDQMKILSHGETWKK